MSSIATKQIKTPQQRADHFKDGVDYDWHYNGKLYDAAKDFHYQKAREPRGDMTKARNLHTIYTTELAKRLSGADICSRLEYTGSAYEGVKVVKTADNKDLEFDIMVIMKGGGELQVEQLVPDRPGYVLLKAVKPPDSCSEMIRLALDGDGYVSADKVANVFHGRLSQCLKDCQAYYRSGVVVGVQEESAEELRFIDDRIRLRKHGPAVQMDIYESENDPNPEPLLKSEPDEGTKGAYVDGKLNNDGDDGEEGAGSDEVKSTPANEPPEVTAAKNGNKSSNFRACKRGKLFYSVDMVPTFEISLNDQPTVAYYVAKPIKVLKSSDCGWKEEGGERQGGSEGKKHSDETGQDDTTQSHHRLALAWRRSFSLDEKKRLMDADSDNGCRKQVLRMLKVIRNREPGLAKLTSYHLKTVLFRVVDEFSKPDDWKNELLGLRLMNVICAMEKELSEKRMPHYFLRDVNILDGIKLKTINEMRMRLKRLKNSETQTMKLLKLKPE